MIRDRIMGSCKDVSELLSRSLDTRLTVFERLRLRLHFRACTYCRQFEDQLHRLRRAGVQYEEECERLTEVGGLSPSARERIKETLRCAEKSSGG